MPDEPVEVWAVCELMGHLRLAGKLSEVERYGGKLARLDVPQPDGSFVTEYFGAASVYRLRFVTEAVARLAATGHAPPVSPWDFPRAIPAAGPVCPVSVDDDPGF